MLQRARPILSVMCVILPLAALALILQGQHADSAASTQLFVSKLPTPTPAATATPAVPGLFISPLSTPAGMTIQFGPSAHPILDWTVDDADQLGTWFTAIFQSDYGEAFDYPHLNALGFPSQLSAYDPNWNSSSDIQPPLAATIMRTFSQHMAHQGSTTTRPHVGAEPGDVVYVSADPLAGYYRIIAIAHAFDTYSRPAYTHTYQLAALPSSA